MACGVAGEKTVRQPLTLVTYVSNIEIPTFYTGEAEKAVHFVSVFPHLLHLAKEGGT